MNDVQKGGRTWTDQSRKREAYAHGRKRVGIAKWVMFFVMSLGSCELCPADV
jgi:hypothetical protein